MIVRTQCKIHLYTLNITVCTPEVPRVFVRSVGGDHTSQSRLELCQLLATIVYFSFVQYHTDGVEQRF